MEKTESKKSSTRKTKKIEISAVEMNKLVKRMEKGFRVVLCPKCKRPTSGKWIAEIIQCGKCGYVKPKDDGKQAN